MGDNQTFIDLYQDDHKPGKVIGRENPEGILRKGIDAEGIIGIDHGALRIQPMIQPGWGRSALVYGPYERRSGLTFAAVILNGHNTSQTGSLGEHIIKRLWRWARGSQTDPVGSRLMRWLLLSRYRQRYIRQFLQWAKTTWDRRSNGVREIDENFITGWAPGFASTEPMQAGNSFIVHATGYENGELWLRVGSHFLPVVRGLQNLPFLFLCALRDKGAAYYISSLPNAHGSAGFPEMRPLAIDPFNSDPSVSAGFTQSVLGQIGFRVDTRVFAAQVEHLPQLACWFGTAIAADRLTGSGPLASTPAETGGNWEVVQGGFHRTPHGAAALSLENIAVLHPRLPSGLVHNLVSQAANGLGGNAGIVWRYIDSENYWRFSASSQGCELGIMHQGIWSEIATTQDFHLSPEAENALQVLDDGTRFSLALNGSQVFEKQFNDPRLGNETGVGISICGPKNTICQSDFEAHPRSIPLPEQIKIAIPNPECGMHIETADDFRAQPGDLAGKKTAVGGKTWRKEFGTGFIDLTGEGSAKVRASAKEPAPRRIVYTVDWDEPDFASLHVTITPPGTARGQYEKCRAGLIFWQDSENFLILNTWLDDVYQGASISSFYTLQGYEEVYDAVWTNVGARIFWGIPYTLRVTFDGLLFTAYINAEPVLYRSLIDVYPEVTRLSIHRIGIVTNWDWGSDTGSTFRDFVARGKGPKE